MFPALVCCGSGGLGGSIEQPDEVTSIGGRTAGDGGICGCPPGGWAVDAIDDLPELVLEDDAPDLLPPLLVWGPAPPEDEYCEYRARPCEWDMMTMAGVVLTLYGHSLSFRLVLWF